MNAPFSCPNSSSSTRFSGKFAQEWIAENKAGCPNFNKLREKEKQHPIEIVGAQLRGMMSWLPKDGKKAAEAPKQLVSA